MPDRTVFCVVWWSSIAVTSTLLATGNGAASAPFSVFNMLCTGYALGWAWRDKRRGGDGK